MRHGLCHCTITLISAAEGYASWYELQVVNFLVEMKPSAVMPYSVGYPWIPYRIFTQTIAILVTCIHFNSLAMGYILNQTGNEQARGKQDSGFCNSEFHRRAEITETITH